MEGNSGAVKANKLFMRPIWGSKLVMDYIPKDKHDVAAVLRAKALGFPAMNSALGPLLDWTKDANWPVAIPIYELLTEAGVEIVPHLLTAFRSDDGDWKFFLLVHFVKNVRPEIWKLLHKDVVRLSTSSNPDDLASEVPAAATLCLARRCA